MENSFMPEGMRLNTDENKYYLSCFATLQKAYENRTVLEAVAVKCDNGMNLEFNLNGIRGIMPKCEVAYSVGGEEIKDIAVITRVGKAVSFIIKEVKIEKNGALLVLSRRLAQKKCADYFIGDLIPGDIVRARVTHLEHFGAFVDIGCGIVALLPIDYISVSRISHPADRLCVGEYIYTVIKNIDYNNIRVYVSHKELLGSWEENANRFSVGQTVSGIVRSIESYGTFVELAPNLAGLAENKSGLCIGDGVSVYIKSIIPDKMKIKLVIIENFELCDSRTKLEYFADVDSQKHIDVFRYSPDCCNRIIESVFGQTVNYE